MMVAINEHECKFAFDLEKAKVNKLGLHIDIDSAYQGLTSFERVLINGIPTVGFNANKHLP